MEGRFLLVFAYCTLVVAHDQSGSIPDSIAACEGGYSCAGDDMKWMIFRQEGIQVPGRFPWLFSYPGELRDSPTRRSEPLLAEQPPREVQHENALPGIGLMPHAGDENLRGRIPDGQQRRELPLERRFGADVVTYLDVDELRPLLRDEVDLLLVQLPDVGLVASPHQLQEDRVLVHAAPVHVARPQDPLLLGFETRIF